jgi:lipopolysaccharide biosynthesis regulator YciM
MEALDLSKAPPRSPKLKLDGLAMLPRTIDKLRASLPGGDMGVYRIDGFSRRMLDMIGVTEEQLREAVATAKSDDDVAKWLREHADTSKYDEFTQYILKRSIDDVTDKAAFMERYPILKKRPDIYYLADMLEADDAEMFVK